MVVEEPHPIVEELEEMEEAVPEWDDSKAEEFRPAGPVAVKTTRPRKLRASRPHRATRRRSGFRPGIGRGRGSPTVEKAEKS